MGDKRGPIFRGRPSPSLKRMRQMEQTELREHAARLQQEVQARERRLENLYAKYGQPPEDPDKRKHTKHVEAEVDRLKALIDEARRLAESGSPS